MPVDEQLCEWPARRMAQAVRRREVSAVELVSAHLDRIEQVNPAVNAVVSLVPEQALAQAREADARAARGEALGPLHGLPVAIKDLMDTAGIRTTYGSPIYADHVPRHDALIAQRMREAGAIVVGKTNTPEFGAGSHTFNPVFGPTRNPYALDRSAGGSSGGAAAALAARLLPLADGSDLGGSIRNPASFCNVVGLRPSAGRVGSTRPGDAWDPASVLGPMARSCADVALLLSVIAGPDDRAPLSLPEDGAALAVISPYSFRGARVALSRTVDGLPFEPAVAQVMDQVAARLSALGAEVVEVEPDLSGADEAFQTLRSLEFVASYATEVREHPALVKQSVRDDVAWGRALTAEQIARAQALRTEVFRRTQALVARFDLLIAPTSQLPPFPVEWEYPTQIAGVPMDRYYTWQRSCTRITTTCLPVLALPAGFTDEGLPVGVQFVGRHRGERRLLAQGAAWEEAVSEIMARRPNVVPA
ncbi:amidase [Streptomyces shenzhenensis]